MKQILTPLVILSLLSCAPSSAQAPVSPPMPAPATPPVQAPVTQPAQAPVIQPSVPGAVATPPFGYPDISGSWSDNDPVICKRSGHEVSIKAQFAVTLISGDVSGFLRFEGPVANRLTRFSGRWDAVGASTFTGTTSQGEKLELQYNNSSSVNIVISVSNSKFYVGLCNGFGEPEVGDTIGFNLNLEEKGKR